MPEALHAGCGMSGQKALPLCACLGLLFLAPVCAGAKTLSATQGFDPIGILYRRDVKITLTFKAPQGFETTGGEARLLSSSNAGAEGISGTFETSEGTAIATFEAQRGGEDKSFPVIELAGQPFDLSSSVDVRQIKPRALEVEADLEASTEETQAFHVTSTEALEDGATLCGDGLSVKKQESLKVTPGSAVVNKDGLDVLLAIQRPEAEVADGTLVLEICRESGRWVYTGYLETLRPVPSNALNIEVKHGGDGAVEVILRPDVVATGSEGKAKVLDGQEELAGLHPEAIVTFRREGDSYLAEVPVDCTAGELILGKLALLARDNQGDLRLFHHPGGVAVCPPLGLGDRVEANPVAWSLIGGACIALLGLAGYLSYDLVWNRRSDKADSPVSDLPQDPPKAMPSTGQIDLEGLRRLLSDTLVQELAPVEKGIRELKTGLAELRERIPAPLAPPVPDSKKGDWEDLGGGAPVSYGGEASGLAELVSRWWREGADRERADFFLRSTSAHAYRSVNIQDSLRKTVDRTFTFQPTNGPVEWLGQQQQGELLIVPADPRLFETGDALKFLGVLFEGVSLGKSSSRIRFRRVVRPCRLQRDPGSQDRYRLAQRGQIEMEGQAEAASTALAVQPVALARVPQASAPAPAGMSETKLARIVQDAVVEAIPRNLTARLEELTRQVRSSYENAPQRAEPARLDADLMAALDAVRQGTASYDGKLRAHASAIQEVKSLVEVLRGDLLRIESKLHHPEPAPPASRESFFSKPMEGFEIDAAVDRLGEGPAQPPPQESSIEMAASPWRSSEPVHVPEQVLEKLEKWWPDRLPAAESIPDGDQLPEPSVYLWRLVQTQSVLVRVGQQRGWEVSLVHLGLPEGSAQSDDSLQITEPVTVSRDFRSASFRGSSVGDALLFQFALSIHGDAGRHIALLPAAGLRVDRHPYAYSRLTLGKLPESATRLTQVIRPAVLSPAGQGGLYTVVSPLKADFR